MSNQETIEKLWDSKDQFDFINDLEAKNSVLDALNLLDKLKMNNIFDGCFDISESDYLPKPHKNVYDAFQKKFNLDNSTTAMFEDLHINLKEPHAMGWKTVWVTNNLEYNLNKDVNQQEDIQKIIDEKGYITEVTDSLENFLININ